MSKENFYVKGTIKIKNEDGVLVPFHPTTKTECIYDYSSSESMVDIADELTSSAEELSKGCVKVFYEPPTPENTEPLYNETLITYMPDYYVWRYKVDFSTERSGYVGIPFNLYGTDASIHYHIEYSYTPNKIYEGQLTAEDFPSTSDNRKALIYCGNLMSTAEVSLYSDCFKDLYIQVYNSRVASIPDQATNATRAWVTHVSNLVELHNPLPKFKGTQICGGGTKYTNSARYLFYWLHRSYNLAKEPPVDLFVNNPQITDFSYCFYNPDNRTNDFGNFDIRIYGPNVTTASNFVNYNSAFTRIVRVPAGSQTETTFRNISSSLGLTVIGE